MQWPDLEAFAEVSEELSFGRAAERLHLSPSAVVRRIQRLERDLGQRLLERSTVHVALTSAGSALAARLPTLTEQWQQVIREVRSPSEPMPRLRLGLIELCSRRMAEHISSGMPERQLDWLTDDAAELSAMLRRGQLDMALLAAFPSEPLDVPAPLHVATVVHEPIWVQIGRAHPLGAADLLEMAQLDSERWVVSPRSQTPFDWESRILANYPTAEVVPTSSTAGRQLIDAGRAVAFTSALAHSIPPYRVVPLHGLAESPARHLYLAWDPALAGGQLPDRVLGLVRGLYRSQARRSPAYWDWICRHPAAFPGIADESMG
ncbi:LysR family transcriptional regulator [Micromonospora sp. R77]|uniref:LysR family transcriptional regulator n=1 Tax=Micromonospora sp. R77 TaxID=2925836 RepID=UPI001F5FFD05|nr:LysR family transcriptional regulator [Micromonospora sp. R77]MCI4061441.1 LysR family transcriptional regulator [Micromonospora sp. R77]